MQMDKVNYKQEALNILNLLEHGVDRKVIVSYVEWVTNARIWWNTSSNYRRLCEAMRFLNLPEPREDEWQNR
jgi:hypothetical protein